MRRRRVQRGHLPAPNHPRPAFVSQNRFHNVGAPNGTKCALTPASPPNPKLRSGPLGKSKEKMHQLLLVGPSRLQRCPRLAVPQVVEVGRNGICRGYRRLLVILIAIVSASMAAAMSESTRPSDGRCRLEWQCRIQVVQLTKGKWQNSPASVERRRPLHPFAQGMTCLLFGWPAGVIFQVLGR